MPGNPAFGATVLRLPAEQSPNFVTGVSGWFIGQDGSAEFNNVVIRGTVEAGQFIGTGEGEEIVIYAGTPAADNVVASVVSAAVTDSFGNDLLIGTTSYHKFASNSFGASNLGGGFVTFYKSSTGMHSWSVVGSLEGGSFTDVHGTQNVVSAPGGMLIGSLGIDSSGIVQTPLTATGGTAANPTVITTDTWTNVTPPTGFTGLLRYRMRAESDVEVEAQMAVGTTAGTGVITLITLPAAYTPASTQRGSCGVFCNGIPSSAGVQGILDLRWSADPAGTFTLRAFPGGAANTGITECSFNIRYALD